MTMISVSEAETKLRDLVREARSGKEIILTDENEPVARLVSIPAKTTRPRPRFGSGRGILVYMADDFNETPEEFKDYIE